MVSKRMVCCQNDDILVAPCRPGIFLPFFFEVLSLAVYSFDKRLILGASQVLSVATSPELF